MLTVWLIGNIVRLINEVTLRRAGLVLRWVTVRWYTVSVFNQGGSTMTGMSSHATDLNWSMGNLLLPSVG